MSRIFGFAVGVIWLLFTLMAVRAAANSWAADQPDAGFWYAVIAGFLAIAMMVAVVGTLRYNYTGPRK